LSDPKIWETEVTYRCPNSHQWTVVFEPANGRGVPLSKVPATETCSACGKLGKMICWGYKLK
jgi:hypothetical protein